MYSVEYIAHAIKDMNKIPAEIKTKIFNAVGKIKEDLYSYIKKLKTSAKTPLYSLRVGEYRVIMAIKDPLLIIQVIEVGNRSKNIEIIELFSQPFREPFKSTPQANISAC